MNIRIFIRPIVCHIHLLGEKIFVTHYVGQTEIFIEQAVQLKRLQLHFEVLSFSDRNSFK